MFLGAGTGCGARRPADVVMLYLDTIGLAAIARSDEIVRNDIEPT